MDVGDVCRIGHSNGEIGNEEDTCVISMQTEKKIASLVENDEKFREDVRYEASKISAQQFEDMIISIKGTDSALKFDEQLQLSKDRKEESPVEIYCLDIQKINPSDVPSPETLPNSDGAIMPSQQATHDTTHNITRHTTHNTIHDTAHNITHDRILDTNHDELTVGSFAIVSYTSPPIFGTIRWIGTMAGINGLMAGLELVNLSMVNCNRTAM